MAQRAVFAPLLGQFDRGLLQVAGMFLELAFKAFDVEPAKPATTLSL
jgi:hypothetical protein